MLHWVRCIEVFTELISPQSVVPRQARLLVTVYARDLFLCVNKELTSPRISLESVICQQDDAEAGEAPSSPSPLHPNVEPNELRTPWSREDPKGKAQAISLGDQRKKRKLVKATPKKSKLVSSAASLT